MYATTTSTTAPVASVANARKAVAHV